MRKAGIPFVPHRGGINEGATIRCLPDDKSFVAIRLGPLPLTSQFQCKTQWLGIELAQ